ncbi:MFS transporter [Pseudofrankia inefficax]|uniref:Major facilitator superfamily MFS_1 n=1 Tax=Pseudofrankia inefficax (strain DSM 45817 / CECT 9037 / DDB 130130 / EuI1c) TaxID=298654 RepID=E3J4F6_PSEI1|nr:MFS transporter [Pseudofrankia inefficax]ADP83075.1 major facilitator superfamily MFS_1 [Pseudofrankia inefficax]
MSAPPADARDSTVDGLAVATQPAGTAQPVGTAQPAGAPARDQIRYRDPARLPYLLSTVGLECMTAVAAPFFSRTLRAAPFALAGVEAAGRAGGAAARYGRNQLADRRPGLRGALDLAASAGLALAAGFLAASGALWQAGACRAGSWAARGLGTPALEEEASAAGPARLGRRLGFERSVGALGGALGALVTVALLEFTSPRGVIGFAAIPIALAVVVSAVAMVRGRGTAAQAPTAPTQIKITQLRGRALGTLLVGVACYEASNIAVVLLLLRASKVVGSSGTLATAQRVALCYGLYQLTAAVCAAWVGRLVDRAGTGLVLAAGGVSLLLAYLGLATITADHNVTLAVCFLLAGAAAGAVDTAEYTGVARLAGPESCRAAFGALAGIQSAGRVLATLTAGGLWTLVGPKAGLLVCGPLLVVATVIFLLRADRPHRQAQAELAG